MRSLLIVVCLVFACADLNAQKPVWQPSAGHTQIAIWPGPPPDPQPVRGPEILEPSGNTFMVAGKQVIGVSNVTKPTITVYSPKGKNTGVAVVVFPGGGYQTLAMDLEGTEVCDWLTPKGIHCVLLKYRVTDVGPYPKSGPYPESPMALEDAQRAMGLCAFTRRSGTSILTRLACLGFLQVGICRQRSARTTRSVCTRLSMSPTKKVADRTLRCPSIQAICRFPRRNRMLSKAPKSSWFLIRRRPINIFR